MLDDPAGVARVACPTAVKKHEQWRQQNGYNDYKRRGYKTSVNRVPTQLFVRNIADKRTLREVKRRVCQPEHLNLN